MLTKVIFSLLHLTPLRCTCWAEASKAEAIRSVCRVGEENSWMNLSSSGDRLNEPCIFLCDTPLLSSESFTKIQKAAKVAPSRSAWIISCLFLHHFLCHFFFPIDWNGLQRSESASLHITLHWILEMASVLKFQS